MSFQVQARDGDATITSREVAALVADGGLQGLRIDAEGVSRHVVVRSRGRVTVLDDVSLTIERGELLAIVGPSGAGKTMALEALAGVAVTSGGSVRFDGVDLAANMGRFRGVIGYVPQDDIIHTDLPLRRTLGYAARLRLPSSTTAGEIDRAVDHAIDAVGLGEQADVRVGSLSGGQRKRASIAVDAPHRTARILPGRADVQPRPGHQRRPDDPLAPAGRRVDHRGVHHPLGRGPRTLRPDRLHGVWRPDRLRRHRRRCAREVRGRLAAGPVPAPGQWRNRRLTHRFPDFSNGSRGELGSGHTRPVANALTQWKVLTTRTLETLVRNPLTLAILLGSPALIIGMFAILFRPGAFDLRHPNPSSMVMIGYWVVFAAFFFGITYGLLQISTERTIVRRERLVGMRLGSYVASKVTVLVPFLLVVNVGMLAMLRQLNRLPERPLATYASMALTLLLCSVAALALGLLTSASVQTVAQATLALPMLCFPAVLFAGAVLPVHLMATAGAALSTTMPTRWAFEAIGHDLGARQILGHGGSPLGPPLLASFGDAGSASTATYWAILAVFAVAWLAATRSVLVRVTRRPAR